jgi:cyclohexanone monooxygenase
MQTVTQQLPGTVQNADPARQYDAVIVGAGFGGMYMLHRLRGLGFSACVVEAGTSVGGTWYWNRYPGLRCDVESLDYQYSFSDELQRGWDWTERYATQPEIERYANYVADKLDLRPDIQFETRVTSAEYDEQNNRWTVSTDRGDQFVAKFLIAATGCLSASNVPNFEGLDTFEGDWYHTGRWPKEGVDFSGKRVAVIGTGSSGIQSIPIIAKSAASVTVFQRTPNYSIPAENKPLTQEQIRDYRANFAEIKRKARESAAGLVIQAGERSVFEVPVEEREREFEVRWGQGGFGFTRAYNDLMIKTDANETIADFVRGKIRQTVQDPAVAELLAPKDHPLGTKRLCVDTDYYATYNRDNVQLVDVKEAPIEEITPGGVKTSKGEYEADIIVFATGFDAMTGALLAMGIRGKGGQTLNEKWIAGPRSYLGLSVSGFPNLFMITGPGSPSVFSNVIISIEQHVEWVGDCMAYMRERGISTIEASLDAENRWVEHVNELSTHTLYPLANSWYLGANIPGKPRVFMPYAGGVGNYRVKCQEIADKGYEGFALGVRERETARV